MDRPSMHAKSSPCNFKHALYLSRHVKISSVIAIEPAVHCVCLCGVARLHQAVSKQREDARVVGLLG